MFRVSAILPGIEGLPWSRRKALTLGFLAAALLVLGLCMARPAHAATFSVDSTADTDTGACTAAANDCTLRRAINAANAASGADIIDFNIPDDPGIPGLEVKTISPTSQLPTITDPVTINGYTQPGASPNTLAVGNNAILKIQLDGASAGAGANGLTVTGSNSTIRGLAINRFGGDGIEVAGSSATGNRVEGNFIGTNAAGTADLGNGEDGVRISDADDNTVGGTAAGGRNVISGNGEGVVISNDSTGNVILGNFIGTNAAGTADLGNGQFGVGIIFASDNTVGGTVSGARNVISGNGVAGVQIAAGTSTGNEVLGNFIGTDVSGTAALGNSDDGVQIGFLASDNTVGGGNRIAHNGGDGVLVFGATVGNRVLSNSIFSNGELGIDLLLGADGVTANDPDDPDTGPNNLQNFPEITSARAITITKKKKKKKKKRRIFLTAISGTLNSTPNQTFTVQLFSNPTADPSGFGEGQTLIGQASVATDSGGNGSFGAVVARGVAPVGSAITGTATDSSGNTSEFSGARVVQ